jgi:hypothetical protein
MLLETSSVPYSILDLFIENSIQVREGDAHRPDRVVSLEYGSNFFVEVLCNEASNVSPLTLAAGTQYKLPSRQFLKYFLEVG